MINISIETSFNVDEAYERVICKHKSIQTSLAYQREYKQLEELIKGHSNKMAQAILRGYIKTTVEEGLAGEIDLLKAKLQFVAAYDLHNELNK